jgi:hypothetical protein
VKNEPVWGYCMLIIMKRSADEAAVDHIKEFLIIKGFDIHQSTGINQIIIGVIGDTDSLDIQELESLDGVLQAIRIMKEGEQGIKAP